MKVIIDHRVVKFLEKINPKDSTKAFEYIELFERFGFELDSRYLKKVKGPVWELRPGKVRLFLFVKSEEQVVIHAVLKKSRKIRREDLSVIEQRIKEYL